MHYCSSFPPNEFRINWLCCWGGGGGGDGVAAVRAEGLAVLRYLCPPRHALTKSAAGGAFSRRLHLDARCCCTIWHQVSSMAVHLLWGIGFCRHSYREAAISCWNVRCPAPTLAPLPNHLHYENRASCLFVTRHSSVFAESINSRRFPLHFTV